MPSAARFILKDSHPAIQEHVTGGSSSSLTGNNNNNTNNNNTPSTSSRSISKSPEKKRSIGLFSRIGNNNNNNNNNKSATRDVSDISNNNSNDNNNNDNNTTAASEVKVQGRAYSTERSKQPGGLKLVDMTMGMKYACMSITDDKPNTLRDVGKANPWQLMSMKLMLQDSGRFNGTNAELDDEIHKPLTELLLKYYDLTVDTHIDISGWKGGHVLDTQGYIAHNDTTIVLAYRCTTSGKDWLTNLATTTSAWETVDIERGHSGILSGLNFGATSQTAAPTMIVDPNAPPQISVHDKLKNKGRVHTGFYNNFLSSVPSIHQYIDPLLADTSKPKTFYIVGHSLGGGIAHMALAYFLLEYPERYNWSEIPHRMVLVTAGSPRAYTNTMQQSINTELIRYKDKVTAIRLVRDKDAVSNVPPTSLGFAHCNKFVYITKDEAILINPNLKNVIPKKKMRTLLERHPSINVLDTTDNDNDDDDDDSKDDDNNVDTVDRGIFGSTEEEEDKKDDDDDDKTDNEAEELAKYERKIRLVPRSLRDHMPEFYLKPLMKLLQIEKQIGSVESIVNQPKPPNENLVILQSNSKTTTTTEINYDVTQNGEETLDIVLDVVKNKKIVNDDDKKSDISPSKQRNNNGFLGGLLNSRKK